MKFIETEIDGCYIVEHNAFHDYRGYFMVPFNRDEMTNQLGYKIDFVQDNMSLSQYGVIRGLHYQIGEYSQAKLVTCVHGEVLDVAVDIRKESKTFGNVVKVKLGRHLYRSLFVPRGCAHGFSVLTEEAIFQYKVDNHYNKESERGIIYNDPTLNIDWLVHPDLRIVHERDLSFPTFLDI
jgi:dTDP-4-dehydrorhamnose 3,5-epimerase